MKIFERNCKVCRVIKAGDTRLERRINSSKMWVPGGESLLSISRDYTDKFIYKGLNNHAKKHQAPTTKQLEHAKAKQELQAIEGEQAVAEVKTVRHFSDDLQELKSIGMEMVRTGDSKVSAAVLAKLIDIEVKIEEKAKDRSFEMAKMVAHFASGAGRAEARTVMPTKEVEADEGELVG